MDGVAGSWIRRTSTAIIMMTVSAVALRSGQDKLNLNSKVLKLFFLPEFNHKKAAGRAVERVSFGGVEGLEGDGEER